MSQHPWQRWLALIACWTIALSLWGDVPLARLSTQILPALTVHQAPCCCPAGMCHMANCAGHGKATKGAQGSACSIRCCTPGAACVSSSQTVPATLAFCSYPLFSPSFAFIPIPIGDVVIQKHSVSPLEQPPRSC